MENLSMLMPSDWCISPSPSGTQCPEWFHWMDILGQKLELILSQYHIINHSWNILFTRCYKEALKRKWRRSLSRDGNMKKFCCKSLTVMVYSPMNTILFCSVWKRKCWMLIISKFFLVWNSSVKWATLLWWVRPDMMKYLGFNDWQSTGLMVRERLGVVWCIGQRRK